LEKRNKDIDILCLQELKGEEEHFPTSLFTDLGYEAALFTQAQYNGVAIVAKNPLNDISRGFGNPVLDEQKRLLQARVNDISIINIYAPHGDERGTDKYKYKMHWYEELLLYLENNHDPSGLLLVAGDFNVAQKEIDVYDSRSMRDAVCTMPEERLALQKIMNWGLIDAYRHLYPQGEDYTWWSYLGGSIWKNEGMRIDYIFCTAPLADRLVSVEVDLWPRRRRSPTPSDHAPLIAEFRN